MVVSSADSSCIVVSSVSVLKVAGDLRIYPGEKTIQHFAGK